MSKKEEVKEKIDTLVGRGIIESSLHRERESFVSLTVKYIVNFIFSCIQFLNIPGFICVAIVSFNPIMGLFSEETKIPNAIIYTSLIAYGVFVVVRHLHQSTITNMTSRKIDLIWFVNSRKDIRNWFYSYPMATKHYSNLEDYLKIETEHYLNEKLAFSNKKINELKEELSRINDLENFPNDTFRSLDLVNNIISEYCTDISVKKVREDINQLNSNIKKVMDDILIEICDLDIFKDKVVKAKILFGGGDIYSDFYYYGGYRVIKTEKETLPGQDHFIKDLINSNEVFFVQDVNDIENEQWFSGWENDGEYNAIIAYPMKLNITNKSSYMDVLQKAKYGVIALHFAKGIKYNEVEKRAIVRILSTYSKSINLAAQIHVNYTEEWFVNCNK